MKNMLLAYFNTTEHKRSDVVAVLGHILDFTDEEIKRVGTGSQPPQATGWFSGLLSISSASRSQPQLDKVGGWDWTCLMMIETYAKIYEAQEECYLLLFLLCLDVFTIICQLFGKGIGESTLVKISFIGFSATV